MQDGPSGPSRPAPKDRPAEINDQSSMNQAKTIGEIRSRADLERHQSARLAALLAEILPRNRFWQAKFAAAGVTPGEIQTPQDLQRLPFVT